MANQQHHPYSLSITPALGGYSQKFGPVTMEVLQDSYAYSLGLVLGKEAAFAVEMQQKFAIESLPDIGMSVMGKDEATRLLRLGHDQFLLITSNPQDGDKLCDTAYSTDQSHNWVFIELISPTSQEDAIRTGLSTLCMLDISHKAFPVNAVARTMMEHMGTLLLRINKGKWVLAAPRSFEEDFLHAIQLSFRDNIAKG